MSPDSPRLVIIDTSGRAGQVALARGDVVCACSRLDEVRRHGRDLAPVLAGLLRGQGWRPRDLGGVLVSLGPGSYTGLRVGIMSAKALGYALGCPVLGVGTFAAIAAQAPAGVDRLDVLADAQQDKVYVQPFGRSGAGAWEARAPLSIRAVGDWLAARDPDAWVSGPGVAAHAHRFPEGLKLVGPELRTPRADSLLAIGLGRYRAGARDDVWALEPIYLRPSAAEEQWRRLGK
jgi:tRNA threonylcarbamoyladenosine biosynthesis protein TsaB